MIDWPVVWRLLAIVCACAWWTGCTPMGSGARDEQKESYFLLGKGKANNLDYQGAADAFEKALEVNPRNASAHYELGLLYEQHLTNYAAAIYHYQRLLKLQPKSDRADIVRPRITGCEQELAKTVSLGPVSPAMQRDLERLAMENQRLKEQTDSLSRRLAMLTNPPLSQTATALSSPAGSPTPARAAAPTNRVMLAAVDSRPPVTAAPTKTYTILQGDTLSSIARKQGVKLEALKAANPRLNPRRLHVGQTVNVPAP